MVYSYNIFFIRKCADIVENLREKYPDRADLTYLVAEAALIKESAKDGSIFLNKKAKRTLANLVDKEINNRKNKEL